MMQSHDSFTAVAQTPDTSWEQVKGHVFVMDISEVFY